MPRKTEPLYTPCCKVRFIEKFNDCPRCGQYVERPIPESELEPEEDIEYLS
jgi:hypothetical protein